jgi:hypothetical protein
VPAPSVTILRPSETGNGQHLRQLRAYYEGTHHDHHTNTWEGAAREPGLSYLQERMMPSGFVPVNSIPYGRRRPNVQAAVVRQVVNRFTEMLLGEGRTPEVLTPADARTQEWLRSFYEVSLLWDVLQEARDVAGSCSASAVVLGVHEGVPWSEVLMPYDLYVESWADGPGWVPEVVVEQRLIERQVVKEGRLVQARVWATRAWTVTDAITYAEVPEDHPLDEPLNVEDERPHGANRCPVVWYQNTRSTGSPFGTADCDGTWHMIDAMDRLWSQLVRASKANVDPTVVVKEEQRHLRRGSSEIVKGQVIQLSPTGSAEYMEMAGTGVEIGRKVLKDLRDEILETAECVIPDPEMAGAYRSVDAMMMVWRSMESKAGRLRVPLGGVICQLSAIAISLGAKGLVKLPPRVREPDKKVDGATPELEELEVGTGLQAASSVFLLGGGLLRLDWPPYWPPTPEQIGQLAVAMKGAVGDKPVLSRQSGVEVMAKYMGLDPEVEQERLDEDDAAEEKRLADAILANTPPGLQENALDPPPAPEEHQFGAGGRKPNPKGEEVEDEGPPTDESVDT